jgi:trimethylamine--corrinoid protein Co-methyltransferase
MRRKRKRRRRVANQETTTTIASPVQPEHRLPVYDILDEQGLQKIHDASMTIMAEIGIDFYDDEARAILKEHGVKVDGDTAFFDPELVAAYVAMAPSQFTQLARNPAHNVLIGGSQLCFAPVYGPPFVTDLDRGRREAKLLDFQNFVKLAYMNPYIHHSGGTIVEPTDEATHTRHLDMVYSLIKYSDKPFMGSVTSASNAQDSIHMAEILFGTEAIREKPALISLINISSPRRLDDRMLGALKVYAKARQAVIITPFILSGAMAPVAVAGTVAQLNAEALAGIVLAQMINPGTPVVYGSFQTNINLQSGAPVFGSPESQLALYASAQLARYYNLPFRSGGMFASSKTADAQAAYESTMVMLPTIMARVNFVLHAAGWLENGLTAGYEKFIMDCQLLGMFHKLVQGLDLSEEGLALEAIREVPPGGHHLGTAHTLRHFRTAFHNTDLFDYNSFEQWTEEGAQEAAQRANTEWKRQLKAYNPPPLAEAVDEALLAFISKRKIEGKPEY